MFGQQSISIFLAASLQLLGCIVSAAPAHQQKRQDVNSPYPVNGVQNGQVYPRLEIRDLQGQQPDQFNIFMLAMRRIQDADQESLLSHFQLSGIHGVPRIQWNGVGGVDNPQNPGYCTHVSNLFLPWHRPYLALYEQVISQHAMDAANTFPAGQQRDRFVNAARQLRLPFWDWARSPSGGNVVPDSIARPNVQVLTAEGLKVIENPLYSYKFHPVDSRLLYSPYVYWERTLRWPTSTEQDAKQQDNILVNQMNNNQVQVRQRLYNLLTGTTNFTEIGTSAWIPRQGPGSYDSLESIHDQVHGTIGGTNYGDMSVIPVSAFDPIFWLHHAMVDRSFALWQSLYPESYVEPMAQKQGAFWYEAGEVLDSGTPLKPFHSDPQGNFWTADAVRDTKTLGYTYPELVNSDPNAIRASINSLYGPGDSNSQPKKRALPTLDLKGAIDTLIHPTNSTDVANLLPKVVQRLYQINYRAPKNGLGESFYIDFFLGKPASEDPNSWLHDLNLIGSQAVLSTIQGSAPVTTSGVLPLNEFLQDLITLGTLGGLIEDLIVKLLQDQITWRVRKLDGSSVPVENVPELVVSLSSREVKPPTSSSAFPQYIGDWKVYPQVTENKSGGLKVTSNI